MRLEVHIEAFGDLLGLSDDLWTQGDGVFALLDSVRGLIVEVELGGCGLLLSLLDLLLLGLLGLGLVRVVVQSLIEF